MQDRSRRDPRMRPHLPAPVAVPVRESLRGLREALHLGRDIAQDVIEHAPLPAPVNLVARTVLFEADRVARRVEDLVTEVARGLLGEEAPVPQGEPGDDMDRRFAVTAAAALREGLARLGAPGAEVDEAAVAGVHAALRGGPLPEEDAMRAALLVQGVLRDGLRPADPAEAEALPVAAFAAMLWLLSDRARDPAALTASIDLAAALGPEIRQAAPDAARLAGLLGEFRDHV